MTPALSKVIEDAYEAFAGYALSGPLMVCRCEVCMPPAIERELRMQPLRELTAVQLFEYTNSAHDRADKQAMVEQRHFLPRYLELLALGQGGDLHPDGWCMSLHRLRATNWRATWPKQETETMDRFVTEFLFDRIGRMGMSSIIAHQSNLILDFSIFLHEMGCDGPLLSQALITSDDQRCALLFALYLCGEVDCGNKIDDEYTVPSVRERLENALFESNDPQAQDILSRGLDVLGVQNIR